MAENGMEKKIELFVVFQEKLAMKLNDSDFRHETLEPMLFSGVTDEHLNSITESLSTDEEISGIVQILEKQGSTKESINKELKVLLKTLIERFSKFSSRESGDSYIG